MQGQPHNVPPHPPSPYRHQYSELIMTTTDSSDSSVTYTMPAYPGSDGTAYSTTSAIYHQPNCNCHMLHSQPMECQSPSHGQRFDQPSDASASAGTNSGSNTVNSSTKETWIHHRPTEPQVRRYKKPIAWIWAGMTLLLFFISVLCLTQTSWIVNDRDGEGLGILKRVIKVDNDLQTQVYSDIIDQNREMSVSWKLSLALYAVSIALLGVSALLALGTVLFTLTRTTETLACTAGSIQLFAVILLITALLFYMVGLDSPVVIEVCKDSGIFRTGKCSVGWNYVLLILCSALGFLLPVLSHYIDNHLCTTTASTESKRAQAQISNC